LKAVYVLLSVQLAVGSQVCAAENEQPVNRPASPVINYDSVSDRLDIDVTDVSLKMLMTAIARDTGIEVLFDDAAERRLSVKLDAVALERGLKQILRGENYLLRYQQGSDPAMLIGVMVLPSGEEETGKERARRIVSMEDEVYYRTHYQKFTDHVKQRDLARQRWQSRMAELPAEVRDDLQRQADERKLKIDAAKKQRHERRKLLEQKQARREARMKMKRDEAWQGRDAADREAFEKKQQIYKEQVRGLIN